MPVFWRALSGKKFGCRVVSASNYSRHHMVTSISDFCAATGSTSQRILLTLCTIFSMLSISAGLFCEDRLRMWSKILTPEVAPEVSPQVRQQYYALWMFMLGQLGMLLRDSAPLYLGGGVSHCGG